MNEWNLPSILPYVWSTLGPKSGVVAPVSNTQSNWSLIDCTNPHMWVSSKSQNAVPKQEEKRKLDQKCHEQIKRINLQKITEWQQIYYKLEKNGKTLPIKGPYYSHYFVYSSWCTAINNHLPMLTRFYVSLFCNTWVYYDIKPEK